MTERRRVCLECATPKRALTDRCRVCRATTVTHYGPPRAPLCNRCAFQGAKRGATPRCAWAERNNPVLLNHALDRLLDRVVPVRYDCPDFEQDPKRAATPSPNPLTYEERENLRAYYTLGAFWLDPYLWEGVDPNKECVWTAQARRERLTGLKPFAAAALTAAALLYAAARPSKEPEQ